MNALWQQKKEGLISLAVLILVLLGLVAILLGPIFYHADRYRSELRKDARILQELRAIEAVQDEINQVQQSYQERNLEGWVYVGRKAGEVSLDVQRKVSDWLSGTQVQRVTPVTAKMGDGYMSVGVQVQFVASLEQLLAVAQNIEESRPLLVVEQMRVAPLAQRRGRNQPEPPQRVTVQMIVQTYVSAGGEQ